jgi:hypothetical protein
MVGSVDQSQLGDRDSAKMMYEYANNEGVSVKNVWMINGFVFINNSSSQLNEDVFHAFPP